MAWNEGLSPESKMAGFSTTTEASSEQTDSGESSLVCTLCGRFTLHHIHDIIENSGNALPYSAILKWQGLLNRARVSNAPDCPATRLRLGPRRDRVAKRPDSGRTTARASVEGRHLLSGFVGRLQPRSPGFLRTACPHQESQSLSHSTHSSSKRRTKAAKLVLRPCPKEY